MTTGYIVIGLFVITVIISLLERYFGSYKKPVYVALGVILMLVAGFREVGIDPDSVNYEYTFLKSDNASSNMTDSIEISYLWISSFINFFTNDVHFLFLFYAFLGITFKFIAFRRLSELWFTPVVVYISYYFIAHEMMQIRTAVLSGLFLLALCYQAEGRRWVAFFLILIGSFFHYSGFMLLPLLFLSSDYMSLKKRLLWVALIPASYVVFFLGISIIMSLDIPLVGAKLASYQSVENAGNGVGYVNVFRPLHLFSIALLSYLMVFYDTIVKQSKYFTLLLKVFILGLCAYEILGFLPVLAQRANMLLLIVTISLYTYISYTFLPKWAAILIVVFVSFVYLNYGLPLISTNLLWNG